MFLSLQHHDCFRYCRRPEEFPASLGLPFMAGDKLSNKNPLSGKDLASTVMECSTRLKWSVLLSSDHVTPK
jgi:hypothetical protein